MAARSGAETTESLSEAREQQMIFQWVLIGAAIIDAAVVVASLVTGDWNTAVIGVVSLFLLTLSIEEK